MQITCLLYADDIVLLSRAPIGLQSSLDMLHAFCDRQGLTVNLKKTQVVVFNDCSHLATYMASEQFTYMGTQLDKVEQYSYLGIIFHRKADFKAAVEVLAVAARKAMFGMMRRCAMMGITNSQLKCQLFDTLVLPVLTYGCEVWGTQYMHSGCEVLEKVHKLFLRKLLGVRNSTANFMMYSEVGRLPLQFVWQKHILKYYNRMVEFGEAGSTRLLMSAYRWVSSQHAVKHSWTAQLQQWITTNGAEDPAPREGVTQAVNHRQGSYGSSAWPTDPTQSEHAHPQAYDHTPLAGEMVDASAVASQPCGTPALTPSPEALEIEELMETARLAYMRLNTINASRKTMQYVSIHGGDWGTMAEYLTWDLCKSHRVELARFRLGAHNLEVETGRWRRLEYEHRLCQYCKTIGQHHVEDEHHFIFECPLYHDIRKSFQICYDNIPRNLFSFFSSKCGASVAPLIHSLFSERGDFFKRLQQSCEPGLAP